MRMSHIAAAAGLIVASLGISTSAEARHYEGGRWHDGHARGWHDRGWHRGPGWHRGQNWHRCHTEWRHHHRVRVCR